MTNKIKVIDNPKTVKYISEDLYIRAEAVKNADVLINKNISRILISGRYGVVLTIPQAKELARVLPEFIKKIEENK